MSAASEATAARIRQALGEREDIAEKKMLGGVCFMLNGNMLVGATASGELMVRVAPGGIPEALSRPGTAIMQMGNRPMKGFISVSDEAVATKAALAGWIAYSEHYVRTLPPK